MSSPLVLSQLRNSLATLYPDEVSIRRIVHDSGLLPERIAFSGPAVNAWHSVLAEASKIGRIDAIVQAAMMEYSNNRELQVAYKAYQESATPNFTNDTYKTKSTSGQPDSPQVFISYTREDSTAALDLYYKLKAIGFRPWIDQEDILPGEEWDLKVRNVLKKTDFLIICLSQHSVARRGYIQREIKMALDTAEEIPEGSIFLIPVRLEDCEVPSRIARYQYVDLFNPKGFDRVVRAITTQWEQKQG